MLEPHHKDNAAAAPHGGERQPSGSWDRGQCELVKHKSAEHVKCVELNGVQVFLKWIINAFLPDASLIFSAHQDSRARMCTDCS